MDKSRNGYRNKHLKLILPVISDNEICARGDPVLNCDQDTLLLKTSCRIPHGETIFFLDNPQPETLFPGGIHPDMITFIMIRDLDRESATFTKLFLKRKRVGKSPRTFLSLRSKLISLDKVYLSTVTLSKKEYCVSIVHDTQC